MPDNQHPDDSQNVVDEILTRALEDEKLPEAAQEVVLAALEGDIALTGALGDGPATESATAVPPSEPATAESPEPVRAFLTSILAQGFRGIGPESELSLHPGPGLTVVCGRNGSGKSSFAEALELALTGNTYRWNKNNTVWTQHWRNLHDGEPCRIRIGIAEEGQGITTVGVDWKDGAGLEDRTTWVQRPQHRRQDGTTSLGWDRALELYRPILSYEELGGLLEAGPSKLFDKLDALLGIEQATDAEARLGIRLRTLQEPEKATKDEAKLIKATLDAVDDERARAALTELRKRHPDLDTLEDIATGTTQEPSEELTTLRAAAGLHMPPPSDMTEAARALRQAVADYAAVRLASAEAAERRTGLLQEALEHHRQTGDGACPVCGQGHLDATWRARVEAELDEQRTEIDTRNRAKASLNVARSRAEELIRAVAGPPDMGPFDLETYPFVDTAWQTWSTLPEDDTALADHLDTAYVDLHEAITLFRNEARTVLAHREDTWAPRAARLASWVRDARDVERMKPTIATVTAAREFMKTTLQELRTKRLARLKDSAREVWAALKQESNVDLGEIELTGTATQRRVRLHADVDGTEAQALGVMSQGELHALALALFLPRATLPGSPFHFVVLDDPIQAMDPAKVDSFVRILQGLATERQVVVFSHDDRLPQAIRDLNVDATILQVVRDVNSAVSINDCLDPAARALDDARALCKDEGLPPDVRKRVIPRLCREAVEAAAYQRYRSQQIGRGVRREHVEEAWTNAGRTKPRIALALHDDHTRDVNPWAGRKSSRRAAVELAAKGVHSSLTRAPIAAVREVEELVRDIREGAR